MAMELSKIEDRLDKTAAGAVAISSEVGGIQFQTMLEVMEFAKLMALSQAAVPSHLRGNPGACLAISIQALEWKMSPFAVANKSYLVNNKGEERIAYESQLLHAIIEARAPLQGRLRFEILGEGDDRRCKVYGTFKGETEPHVYISETLGKLRDSRGRNDYGKLKGSPLWDTQPEVQLFYSASRQWGRLYCPDTILGIYTPEELDNQGPDHAKDVTPRPSVGERLKGSKGRGFNASHVEREARGGVIEECVQQTDTQTNIKTAGEPPATESNSPQASSHSEADKPATETSPSQPTVAGNLSQAKATEGKAGMAVGTPHVRQTTAGTGLRVGEASADLPATSELMDVTAGETALLLPTGWENAYSAALKRAQSKPSLEKFAQQFWTEYGGWPAHKNGPNAVTAVAIFEAYNQNFGNKDAIAAALREVIP